MARQKGYTLGAGKLYFNREVDGEPTGEYYIGNTTSLTGSTDEEREEHYSSDEKERARDASVVTRSDNGIGFTTDDIQPENLAMLWKGTADVLTVAAIATVEETIKVRKGRWYQLGEGPTNPTGHRAITLTSVTDDGDVAIPGGNGGVNFEVDTDLARLFIKEDATGVEDGDSLTITYAVKASSRTVIISKGETIRGSLRYIADNTQGENRDDFWPLVEISPDGDYEFKGDSWSEMSFSGEVIKKPGYEKHYTDGRAVVA